MPAWLGGGAPHTSSWSQTQLSKSKSMRNTEEITCGCGTCICSQEIPQCAGKLLFSAQESWRVFISTEKHSDSYRNTKTQQVCFRVETKWVREFVVYLIGWGISFFFQRDGPWKAVHGLADWFYTHIHSVGNKWNQAFFFSNKEHMKMRSNTMKVGQSWEQWREGIQGESIKTHGTHIWNSKKIDSSILGLFKDLFILCVSVLCLYVCLYEGVGSPSNRQL